jgi:ligand-binding sensor domain-containing protein/DNA-binding CsgD family transcriptional regulator
MIINRFNKSINNCLLVILIVLVYSNSLAQINKVGTPLIKNYSRLAYNAGPQNWMIDQSEDGRIYFANNNGVLEFDGINWNLIPLPNEIVVRSVYVSNENRIYAGGFNEFGYFEPNSKGRLVYHSLMDIVPIEDRNFDEIWRIHETPDGLVFQSFTQLIFLQGESVKVVKAPGRFHFSYLVNGQLILVDLEKGLFRYSMGQFFPLIGTDQIKGQEIWSVLPYGNKLLIATAENGIFIYDGNNLEEWSSPASDFLKRNQVFSAIRINEDYLAFGTIQKGILICTNEGLPVQKISRENGLQNNTVLCLKKDRVGNMWLGTDNGIDYLEINSPLSILSHEHGIGAGYTAAVYKDYLYLGTNQGVLYRKWDDFLSTSSDGKFDIIESTRGQIWTLQLIDNHLFCGNNKGAYIIEGNTSTEISDVPGVWTFLKMPKHEDKIIAGTYSGLILFSKSGNKWRFDKSIKGFNESSRIMEVDTDGSIWMSHGFKGVFHIYLNQELDSVQQVDFYNSNNGFSSEIGINVTHLKGEIYFSASDGVYKYNLTTDAFEKENIFNELLPPNKLIKLKEDNRGNIWCFSDDEVSVLRLQEDGAYSDIRLPFKQLKGNLIGGFEFVYPINDDHILFGASSGFIHYNPQVNKDYKKPFSVYISKITAFISDSVIFSGHVSSDLNEWPAFKFRNNATNFSFAANDFENAEKTEFSSYLEGYDTDWTLWELRNNREFTNLYEGNYTFFVKARNIYGAETDVAYFKFTINPPWERTIVAYIIYVTIGLIFIGFMLLLIKKKIERSKRQEKIRQQNMFKEREEKLQLETLEAEKEIIRLRNEKLREEMIMKDKELANSTLDMIQKNKLLTKIKNDLKKISSATRDLELKDHINILSKKINRELDTEQQWEVFETHFENVHEAFLKRLKIQFPDLSPRELKLCAYLRLNISSKEIAILMNISTRGVEISRYRLRKKLDLQRNENLTDFILTF